MPILLPNEVAKGREQGRKGPRFGSDFRTRGLIEEEEGMGELLHDFLKAGK